MYVLLVVKGAGVVDDQLTIEEIYDLPYRDVYHFAIYYTNRRDEAEDITQETFIKAMRNLSTLKSSNKVRVWILSIAKNTAIDYTRKRGRRSFLPYIFNDKASDDPTPEERMIKQDEWNVIQNALLKLKPKYRSLIILRGIKEYTIRETAEILGIPELKVRVDYHRAMKHLKNEIGNLGEGAVLTNER